MLSGSYFLSPFVAFINVFFKDEGISHNLSNLHKLIKIYNVTDEIALKY